MGSFPNGVQKCDLWRNFLSFPCFSLSFTLTLLPFWYSGIYSALSPSLSARLTNCIADLKDREDGDLPAADIP